MAAFISWYFFTGWLAAVAMLLVVPFRREPDAAKDWLLLMLFLPWIGLLVFYVVGAPWPTRTRRRRDREVRKALAPLARQLADCTAARRVEPPLSEAATGVVRLAERLGHHPVLDGNAIELLTDYDGAQERLLADIAAARHHVHLLFYMFADDRVGRRFGEALAGAAARGVICRLLIDEAGSITALRRLVPELRAAGIEVQVMLPMGRFRGGGRADLRNHRKISVIDGRIGHIGSQNIVHGVIPPGVPNEELNLRLAGPAVLELQAVFAHDWYLETEQTIRGDAYFPEPEKVGRVAAQVLPSGPLYPVENIRSLLVSLIHGANRRVILTSPYFIPDGPLLDAMGTAALRGAEVRLILSGPTDQRLVSLAQASYYRHLLDAGIQVYHYRPGFLHAKLATIDDDIGLVGSSNLDIRSFELNEEVSVLIYDAAFTKALRKQQDGYLDRAERLTVEAWEERPVARKIVENTARLLSPIL